MVRAPTNNAKRPGEKTNSHSHGYHDKGKIGARFGGSRNGGNDRFNGKKSAVGENSSLTKPDWSAMQLSAFKKHFYKANTAVEERSQFEVDAFRTEHAITIRGKAPNPIMNFDEINMPDYVMNEIRRQGYEKPTPIQAQGKKFQLILWINSKEMLYFVFMLK